MKVYTCHTIASVKCGQSNTKTHKDSVNNYTKALNGNVEEETKDIFFIFFLPAYHSVLIRGHYISYIQLLEGQYYH